MASKAVITTTVGISGSSCQFLCQLIILELEMPLFCFEQVHHYGIVLNQLAFVPPGERNPSSQ